MKESLKSRKRSVKIYRKTPEAATLPGPATLLKKSLSCQRHSCFLESLRSFEENFLFETSGGCF